MSKKNEKRSSFTIWGLALTMLLFLLLCPHRVLAAGVQQISLGNEHSAALLSDGSLWTWGRNDCGQLGDGTTENASSPKKIMSGVKQVSLGFNRSAAVKTDGTLWMWGEYISNTPKKVMSGVKQVSLSQFNQGFDTAAVKTNGTLWMWGITISDTPQKIMSGVKEVTLGYMTSAVIKMDGSLWTWGENYYGQLGDGTTENASSPKKIMSGVKQVSLGLNRSAAIKTDGSLWIWGYQAVEGTDSKVPTKVMEGVKQVCCNGDGYAALKTNGSLSMWGVFDETTMSGVTQVSLSSLHHGVVKSDGSLWMWGLNSWGQLGNGSISYDNNSTPIRITLPPSGSGNQLAKPKAPTVSNAANGVRIQWSKVSGAAKYRVFYKIGTGNWKKITDTTKTSVTWKGAVSGTDYTFCVRCLSSDGKSYTSTTGASSQKLTYIAAPQKIKVTKSGSKNIKISWAKSKGAVKYRIFYKTGSGSWKKLTDTAASSYTWKKGKKGTTYVFTVRCVTSDGKSYTSAYNTSGVKITL